MKSQSRILIKIFFIITAITLVMIFSVLSFAEEKKDIRILYTSDIHSNFEKAAKLKTIIDSVTDENTIYLDCGDIAMGRMMQCGFTSDAFELRILGVLGCDVVTVGNHEWDLGGYGFAKQLDMAAKLRKDGEKLPFFVQSNLDFSGELTEEQSAVKQSLENYGFSDYTILNVNDKKIAVFALLGESGIEDAPTSGMKFINYIDCAKEIVKRIKNTENPDCIICLSHSGIESDGKSGEDFDLVDAVPDIDIVISGHSHSEFKDYIKRNNTILVSCGSNMDNLGVLDITIEDGEIQKASHTLLPVKETIKSDVNVKLFLDVANKTIEDHYLSDLGIHQNIYDVIAYSPFDTLTLDDMYDTYDENPVGNLIADSYIYETRKNGIEDVDIAFVGLGTIRNSIHKGGITLADAFEMCSLGMGIDGSVGHPIIGMYLSGKEIKLFAQLESTLYPLSSSIKFSSAGLEVRNNLSRMPFDRVTDIHIRRYDGSIEEIEDDKLYKVACNMYAANMLGMVNDLTKGILKFVIKDEFGNPVEDLYSLTLMNKEGKEIKEWVAYYDYLCSFDKLNGVSTIPNHLYSEGIGRKVIVREGGLHIIENPNAVTVTILVLVTVFILAVFLLMKRGIKKIKKRKNRD